MHLINLINAETIYTFLKERIEGCLFINILCLSHALQNGR